MGDEKSDAKVVTDLTNMTKWMPSRKVGGGVIVGTPYGIVSVWLLQSYILPADKPMPAEIAAAIGSIIGGLAAYFMPGKD